MSSKRDRSDPSKRHYARRFATRIEDVGKSVFTPEMLMEALSARYDRLCAFELDRARKMLAAGQPAHVAMEALSRRLTSKVLHDPLSSLSAAGSERARLAAALMRIYRGEAGEASC